MKKQIIILIEKIHFLIFRSKMSPEMRKFLGNLSWSISIGIIIVPLMMLVTTLAGRYMGPIEYGKYSLLIVINQFLLIFVFFGLDTVSVKNISKAETVRDKKKLISAILYFILTILLILSILTILAYPILFKYLNRYSLFAIFVSYYTIILTIKLMFDWFIRGIGDFKRQAFGKILETLTVLIIFIFIFYFLHKNNFLDYIFVVTGGMIEMSFYYFLNLRKYFGNNDNKILKKQLGDAKIFFIGSIFATIYLIADRLVVARFLGIESLGIYSAYYFASFTLITQVTQFFNNVFFPTSARIKDKSFTKKIDRLFIIGLIPLTFILCAVIILMLLLFGKNYPINSVYVFVFAFYSAIYFFQAIYGTVVIDAPYTQYKKYLIFINSVNFLSISLYGLAIYLHILSIPFILIVLILNNIITIYIQRLYIKIMLTSQDLIKC